MEFELKEGMEFVAEQMVTDNDTASKYGSGLVEVFATPAMIALMEKASLNVVLPKMAENYNTVGTFVNVKHIKATPVGKKVTCKAILTKVEGKKLEFAVEAWDEDGKIGFGTHGRYIIDTTTFGK